MIVVTSRWPQRSNSPSVDLDQELDLRGMANGLSGVDCWDGSCNRYRDRPEAWTWPWLQDSPRHVTVVAEAEQISIAE